MNSVMSLLDSLHLSQLQQFHFLRPWWLLSIVPLFIFYRSMVAKDDLSSQWSGVMSKKMIQHLTINQQQTRTFTPKNLFLVFAVLSTLIMAGPTWTKKATPFFVDQSALIIALDVSESMQNSDIQPSRLLRAKQKITELLTLRGDAKTGLIVYAGSAHIAMPITQDKKMIHHFLDALDTDLLPVKESKPESLVAPATELLDQTKFPSTLLLLTDKTNQQSIDQFSAYFQQKTHQLVVWAIGENPQSGLDSATGISTEQLSALDNLATSSHGDFVPFTHNSDDIAQINRHIDNNMASVDDKTQPWFDQGYLLLFLLLPLQALWFRRGWTMQW